MNFTPVQGTPIDCKNAPSAAPCIIASLNGYDGTLAANRVVMTFPQAVAGATPPEGVDVPFIQVDVSEQVPAYFSRLLTANSSVTVSASATCGLEAPAGPVPIVVLHPTTANAISMGGTPNITIIGGPQRSVQVNSSSATPVSLSNVDLSKAGPGNTGGDFAQFGGNGSQPGGLNLGSTGTWQYPSPPISDPYRSVAAPSTRAAGTKSAAKKGSACKTAVAGCYKVNGCPNSSGCDEYTAGSYNSLSVKNATAIFDPGVYYVTGGMSLDSNSNVRVSTANGDGSSGVMFYFSGSGSISVASNSGSGTTDAYRIDGGTSPNGVPSRALQCPGGAANPPQLPATMNGNVLLGPCTGTYGDPTGRYRGFVFFQDRSAAAAASWGGGGQSLLAGLMYFHQCRANGTGLNCSAPGSGGYGSRVTLGGNSGSGAYTVGSLVTDTLSMNGTPNITMILSPYNSFPQLKVAFLK